jgi:hypothetical protein
MMLCNIILIITLIFAIYIERSMSIFIIYIGIIGSMFRFGNTNFKAPLIVKMISLKIK